MITLYVYNWFLRGREDISQSLIHSEIRQAPRGQILVLHRSIRIRKTMSMRQLSSSLGICVRTKKFRVIGSHGDNKKRNDLRTKKIIRCIVRDSQIARRRYLSAPDSTIAKCVNKNRKSPRFPGGLNRVDAFVSVDVPNRRHESYLTLGNQR